MNAQILPQLKQEQAALTKTINECNAELLRINVAIDALEGRVLAQKQQREPHSKTVTELVLAICKTFPIVPGGFQLV